MAFISLEEPMKLLIALLICAFYVGTQPAFASEGKGPAAHQPNPKSSKPVTLRARLAPVADYTGTARGQFRSWKHVQKKSRSDEKFNVNIHFALPDAALGLADAAAATGADIRLDIARADVVIAECLFDYNAAEENAATEAVFQIAIDRTVRRAAERLRARKGGCDIDMALDGIQAGLPVVQKDDVLRVIIMKEGLPVQFLEGKL
jgi:hypothetical protein